MPPAGRRRAGCAVAFLGVVAVVVGAGIWLNRVDEASKSPCRLFAEQLVQAFANCHSGQERNLDRLTALCERDVDPGEACLQAIDALSCAELEAGAGAVASNEACRRQP